MIHVESRDHTCAQIVCLTSQHASAEERTLYPLIREKQASCPTPPRTTRPACPPARLSARLPANQPSRPRYLTHMLAPSALIVRSLPPPLRSTLLPCRALPCRARGCRVPARARRSTTASPWMIRHVLCCIYTRRALAAMQAGRQAFAYHAHAAQMRACMHAHARLPVC